MASAVGDAIHLETRAKNGGIMVSALPASNRSFTMMAEKVMVTAIPLTTTWIVSIYTYGGEIGILPSKTWYQASPTEIAGFEGRTDYMNLAILQTRFNLLALLSTVEILL